jgi:hypothetical protein
MLKAMLKHIGERVDYHHQVYRIVESQAIVATTTLVDDLEEQNTVLAECAYYRFAFLTAMEQPYAKAIQSEHLIFCVRVDSAQAVDLTQLIVPKKIEQLTDKQDYSFTRRLGKALVNEHEAKVIRYYCARADVGINVAVANPSEITSTQPQNPVNWLCHITPKVISFNTRGQKPISFEKTHYCVDGIFPVPA